MTEIGNAPQYRRSQENGLGFILLGYREADSLVNEAEAFYHRK